jgi:predicted nucleic acid-binding protein
MNELMFDTNIFNKILDGKIEPSKLNDKICYVTHVQFDEIQATKDKDRRLKLEEVFSRVLSELLPTESFILDVSRLDEARLGAGVTYEQLFQRLNELNKSKPNNVQDALIGETALNNGITLVTEDLDLIKVITEFGGSACKLQEVIST